tara:strand:- start:88 stop:369 length:282 start_codon:yes stop_codon:yes gene_type:complete
MKTTKEIRKRILDNPLLTPAISLAMYSVKNYTNKDWEQYEKETGNKRVSFPKNDIEKMIDKATGFEDENQKNLEKFILYNIDGFEKGLNDNLK